MIWLRQHRAELRLGLRITIASLLSFALCHVLGLVQSYVAVLTSVIVMQGSVGASVKAMLDRFVGSLAGAAWGVAVVLLVPRDSALGLGIALAVAIAPLGVLAALKPPYRAAPATAILLLITPINPAGPFVQAFQRMAEIGVGSVVALAVALLVLPARAHDALAEAAGRALLRMGDLAGLLMNRQNEPEEIQKLHDEIREAIREAEASAEEAAHERQSYLTAGPDPQPICRALRRVRTDLSGIGRITAEPLPETLAGRLAEATTGAVAALAAYLRASGDAIRVLNPLLPPLDEVRLALAQHAAAMTDLRKSGLTRELPDETIGRIFGLAFALEQLYQNLEDLADRARELTAP